MLSNSEKINVANVARGLLGVPYTNQFRCVDFVALVYKKALNCSVPTLDYNLTIDDLSDHRIDNRFCGYVLFLRRKDTSKESLWTHMAILLDNNNVIHNSWYYGRCVVVTPINELLNFYDIVVT